MTSVGEMNSQKHYMAHQHSTKPVTKAQKKMSKIHKDHRKEIDKMPDGSKKKAKADHYDSTHGVEHLANLSPKGREKVQKKLIKIGFKIAKKSAS